MRRCENGLQMHYAHPVRGAAVAVLACAGLAAAATAQEPDQGDSNGAGLSQPRDADPLIRYYMITPEDLRAYGTGWPLNYHHPIYAGRFPSELILRPMTPWAGRVETRLVGEADLGAGHAGSPLRFSGTVAYGLGEDDLKLVPWGVAVETGRGLCVHSADGRCDRWFDQVSADVIYVSESREHSESLMKGGLAIGPFDPFVVNLRAGWAAKVLLGWCAVQVDILAQGPVNQRDSVPILFATSAQLQMRLNEPVAAYLIAGFRGSVLMAGDDGDAAVPVGVGLLIGSRWFDVGAEWRFPRVLGTARTWNDRALLVTVVFRNWWHTFQDAPYRHPSMGNDDDPL
jgi:hypothetical protein